MRSSRVAALSLVFGALLLLVPIAGQAAGPGVHIREADRYAALHPDLADPALRPFLRLGAFFPDIRGGLDLPVNTHAKGLGHKLMELAVASGEPWKIAFATGYRLHTASDTAAQVYYIPWMTAQAGLGAVNFFGLEDIDSAGDNELLAEAWGDFFMGDLDLFIELVFHFVIDQKGELEPVVGFFLEGLAAYVGPSLDIEAVEAQVYAVWAKLEGALGGFDVEGAKALLDMAKMGSLEDFLVIASSGMLDGVLAELPGGTELVPDPYEVARLMAHPVGADPATFFGFYDEHFTDLGPGILDDPGYEPWSHYSKKSFVSGIFQSLAVGSERWESLADVLLYDASFRLPDSTVVTTLDPANLPSEVIAQCDLFLVKGDPREIELEVRADPAGIALGQATVVGTALGEVSFGPQRLVLEVSFDPAPYAGAADSFVMALSEKGSDKPFLVTDFEQYAAYAEAPLFRPPWPTGYQAFPPKLRVSHAVGALADVGSVRGHVHSGGAGMAALVGVGDEPDLLEAVQTNGSGAFVVEPLEPGLRTFTVGGVGITQAQAEVEVEAGRVVVLNLEVEPLPIVAQGGGWTSSTSPLSLGWTVEHFPLPPEAFEVSALAGSGTELVPGQGDWHPVGGELGAEITVAEPIDDGGEVTAFVRADGGTAARAVLRVDASAPLIPNLEVLDVDCWGEAQVRVTPTDPHSPIVEVRVGLSEELDVAKKLAGTVYEHAVPVLEGQGTHIYAWARNAAGLWSEPAHLTVCDDPEVWAAAEPVEPDGATSPPPPPDASDETEPDAGAATAEPAPQATGEEDSGGCSATPKPASSVPSGLLVCALLLALAVRRKMHRAKG